MKLRTTVAVLQPLSLPKKGPVPAAERNVAVGSFRGAVVDLQLAVLQQSRQRLPSTTRYRLAVHAIRYGLAIRFRSLNAPVAFTYTVAERAWPWTTGPRCATEPTLT
jgi:hypothetical protein